MSSPALSGPETKPLPMAVFSFMTSGSVDRGGLAAAATLIAIPVPPMTLLVREHIVEGRTFGAMKGRGRTAGREERSPADIVDHLRRSVVGAEGYPDYWATQEGRG